MNVSGVPRVNEPSPFAVFARKIAGVEEPTQTKAEKAEKAREDGTAELPSITILREALERAQEKLAADLEAGADEATLKMDRAMVQSAAAALSAALDQQAAEGKKAAQAASGDRYL